MTNERNHEVRVNHGGKRKGSGRKSAEEKGEEKRKPYSFRLTENEHKIVKEFIKNLKKKNV